jgi:hypothetical protein
VEWQVTSEDYGKGLADVQNLLRKHGLLESDVTARQVCFQHFADCMKLDINTVHIPNLSLVVFLLSDQETKGKFSWQPASSQ